MGRFRLWIGDDEDENDDEELQQVEDLSKGRRDGKTQQLEQDQDQDSDSEDAGWYSPSSLRSVGSWGRTRFSLHPPRPSDKELYQTYLEQDISWWEDDDDDDEMENDDKRLVVKSKLYEPIVQSQPPLSSLRNRQTISNAKLWECSTTSSSSSAIALSNNNTSKSSPTSTEDPMMELVLAQTARLSIIGPDENIDMVGDKLAQVTQWGKEQLHKHAQKGQLELAKNQERFDRDAKLLKLLVQQDVEEANRVLKREKQARELREQQHERERKKQEEKDQAKKKKEEEERKRLEAAAAQKEKEKQQQSQQQQQQQQAAKENQQQQAKSSSSRPRLDHVEKAHKYMKKLVEVQNSVAAFGDNKAVSKRRLTMKRLSRGKLNTLSADPQKVVNVAAEISQAIAQERRVDEQLKKDEANPAVTPDMARGRRYFCLQIASTVMLRCQAEGFNGPRGDGFPLAAFLAIIAADHRDFVPMMAAHVHTVCPIAIPTLPEPGASENDFMAGLGMIKDKKTGDFETFDRFLTRTEGIIALVAGIMASMPQNHVLFDGHKGAIEWLARFLNLLPPAPQPLNIIVAPVLDAFLRCAGHMLANIYPDRFKPYLDTITNDIVHRLDESDIGAPRALRLKKTVEGGFAAFRDTLPARALVSLYNVGAKTPTMPVATNTAAPLPAMSSSFGNAAASNNPFGGTSTSNPFGGGTVNAGGGNSNPFGGGASNANPSNPFGGGGNANTTPFGSSTGGGFGTSAANTPFGGAKKDDADGMETGQDGGPGQSPFGNPGATQPFGAAAAAPFGNAAPSPFGAGTNPFASGAPGPSPFGGAFGSSSAPSPSPFGGGPGNAAPSGSQTPFGSAAPSAASPFGAASGPFGSAGTPATTPFGGPTPAPAPFGAPASGAPFGGPSPFGSAAPAPTPFGNAAPNPSPFGQGSTGGNAAPAPFGASPFGTNTASGNNPFGSTPGANAFGGQQQQSPFAGGAAPSPSPFSGGRKSGQKKKPCKFFAQGNCRYGANCRYSHETPPSGGNGGAFGSNNKQNAFGFGANSGNNTNRSPFSTFQ